MDAKEKKKLQNARYYAKKKAQMSELLAQSPQNPLDQCINQVSIPPSEPPKSTDTESDLDDLIEQIIQKRVADELKKNTKTTSLEEANEKTNEWRER